MAKAKKIGIPFKSKLIGIRNIKKRNAAFDALTDKEKRREIAFDALYLAITRKLEASVCGDFWNDKLEDSTSNLKTPKDLQTFLVKEIPESCEVCQRGLMMVSQIRLGNTIAPDDEDRESGNEENLKGFSIESFENMEGVFEGWQKQLDHPYGRNTQELLANICCNVIKNGDFNINDTTDYLKKWGLKIATSPVKKSIKTVFAIKD